MTLPTPTFDSIDYIAPTNYLALHPSFAGDGAALSGVDARLRGASDEATLANIWRWLRDDFAVRNITSEYGWRTVAEIVERKSYIGCADHALVYGCAARACGIPTVWVKSLDASWIRNFRNGREWDGGNGHVFLEMFIENRWRLVDATQDEIFDEYDPAQRLLPGRGGDRYAYDKGGDPRALVLSLDWTPWVEETKRVFSDFDVTLLNDALPATRGKGRRLAV